MFEPESTAAFAYSNVYADAPNPCLGLDGVGHISLPLSERDALAIASVSVAGMGVEQGLWTLPGDKVKESVFRRVTHISSRVCLSPF